MSDVDLKISGIIQTQLCWTWCYAQDVFAHRCLYTCTEAFAEKSCFTQTYFQTFAVTDTLFQAGTCRHAVSHLYNHIKFSLMLAIQTSPVRKDHVYSTEG